MEINKSKSLKIPSLFNEKGVLMLPLLVFLMIGVVTGFQIWELFRSWRLRIETQIRLDRCVGQVTHEFRELLDFMEVKNQKIRKIRAAIQADRSSSLLTSTGWDSQLASLVQSQQEEQMKWEQRQVQWSASHGCGSPRDRALQLPVLKYVREPPDSIGPQELSWMNLEHEEFWFQVSSAVGNFPARYSTAKLESLDSEGKTGRTARLSWQANWVQPSL